MYGARSRSICALGWATACGVGAGCVGEGKAREMLARLSSAPRRSVECIEDGRWVGVRREKEGGGVSKEKEGWGSGEVVTRVKGGW